MTPAEPLIVAPGINIDAGAGSGKHPVRVYQEYHIAATYLILFSILLRSDLKAGALYTESGCGSAPVP